MADDRPIIVIKRRKKAHAAHHGGAWKVAYADFVTAMMAFFLLMWLLSVTSNEQRSGISNYFSPVGSTQAGGGVGGLFGGRTIQSEGSLQDDSAKPSAGQNFGLSNSDQELEYSDISTHQESEERRAKPSSEEEQIEKEIETLEEKLFKKAEMELKEAVKKVPEIASLAENLIIDYTPEGMRIQIIDKNRYSSFPSGSDLMYEHTYHLLTQIAAVIRKLPNRVSIAGHTDAQPYRNESEYGNWELSLDRSNASRRALIKAGFPSDRIQSIVGRADTDPYVPDNPMDAQNRRISIVLLRNSKAPSSSREESIQKAIENL